MFQTIMVKDRHRSIKNKGVLYYRRTFVELLFNRATGFDRNPLGSPLMATPKRAGDSPGDKPVKHQLLSQKE